MDSLPIVMTASVLGFLLTAKTVGVVSVSAGLFLTIFVSVLIKHCDLNISCKEMISNTKVFGTAK